MGSGSSVAVSGWENISPARQQELIVLHTDMMTKNNRQETEVVTLLTIVEWQRIHCSAIRPANAIKYAGLFVDNGITSIEALGMKIGHDKDWLEGTLGMDMFDSEELVDALNKQHLVKMSAVVASSSASASSSLLPTVAIPTTPTACIEALTTALQATITTTSTDNNSSSSSVERDLYPSSLKNALKGIEIVARGNPIEQEELGAGGGCDMLVQLLTKAAVDHMNLAEGNPPSFF